MGGGKRDAMRHAASSAHLNTAISTHEHQFFFLNRRDKPIASMKKR